VPRIALSPDGKVLAGDHRFTEGGIRLWDRKTGKELHRLRYESGRVLVFTPNSQLLITAFAHAQDPSLWLPRLRGCIVWDVKSGKELRRFDLRKGQGLWGACAVVDNKTLVVGGTEEVAELYDLRNGRSAGVIKGKHRPRCLAVSRDGKWLLTGGQDNHLCLWDLTKRQLVHTLYEHTSDVVAVAISPDGKWCASATKDRRLWVFDRATGAERRRTPTLLREGARTGLAFTADGKTLVAAGVGPSRGMAIWDWQARRHVRGDFPFSRPSYEALVKARKESGHVESMALAPDGRTLFTVGMPPGMAKGTRSVIQVWDLAPPKPVPKR
jgi:WD40 repeat protein